MFVIGDTSAPTACIKIGNLSAELLRLSSSIQIHNYSLFLQTTADHKNSPLRTARFIALNNYLWCKIKKQCLRTCWHIFYYSKIALTSLVYNLYVIWHIVSSGLSQIGCECADSELALHNRDNKIGYREERATRDRLAHWCSHSSRETSRIWRTRWVRIYSWLDTWTWTLPSSI